jgi:tetratricopeptide (TPR) repeat protein
MAPTAHSRAAPPRAGAVERWELLGIAAIAALALALRVWNLLELRAHDPFFADPSVDERMYHQWASAIARGEGLGDRPFLNGPAYPVFLAGVYALFGPSLLAAKALQTALATLDCVLLWALGRKLLGPGIALGAAALLAVCELAIFYPATLLLEGALGTLVLGMLWLCVRASESGGPLRWGAAGLATGLTALARPNALIFAALLCGWAALRPGSAPKRRAAAALAYAAGVVFWVSLSALHNARAAGDFVPVTYAGGMNLYIGNNPAANGEFRVPPIVPSALADDPEEQRVVFQALAERATGRPLRPSEVSDFWSGQAVAFVRDQPLAWLRLMGRKIALSFNAYEPWSVRSVTLARDASQALRLPLLGFGALAPFALLGLWATRGAAARLFPLYAWLGTVWLTLWSFFVLARYRASALALVALFAAAGFAYVVSLALARRPRALVAAGAAVATAMLAVQAPIARESLGVAYYNLGNRLRDQGQLEPAVNAYLESMRRAPAYLSTYNNLAMVYEQLGWREEAAKAWSALGQLAERQGSPVHVKRAQRHLETLESDGVTTPQ